MFMRLARLFVWSASFASVGVACSDSAAPSTAPLTAAPEASQQALLGGLLGTLTQTVAGLLVAPIERVTPLADDVSWSFTAGPGGAASFNPGVGLWIVVPPNAMSSTQTITVTALQGADVAYKFEPHGLVFSRKVLLTQDLRGTTGSGLLSGLLSLSSLQAGYFPTDRPETTSGGLVKVTQLLPALSSTLSNTVTFGIQHFSGYIVASGRSRDSESAY